MENAAHPTPSPDCTHAQDSIEGQEGTQTAKIDATGSASNVKDAGRSAKASASGGKQRGKASSMGGFNWTWGFSSSRGKGDKVGKKAEVTTEVKKQKPPSADTPGEVEALGGVKQGSGGSDSGQESLGVAVMEAGGGLVRS